MSERPADPTREARTNSPERNAPQVMHLDLVALAEGATNRAVDALIEAAAKLAQQEDVVQAGVIRGDPGSDFDLAFYFVLRNFAALEPFGTHEEYSRFLQVHVAPVLRHLSGADVVLESKAPEFGGYGTCVALAAEEETYDWEVWDALKDWAAGLDAAGACHGLAAGERQRYRGVALAVSVSPLTTLSRPADERFSTAVVGGKVLSLR